MKNLIIMLALAGCGGSSSPTTCQHPFGTVTQACDDCQRSMCDSQNVACLGANYKSGNFSGPCADLINCTCACTGGTAACVSMCSSKNTTACQSCSNDESACVKMNCSSVCTTVTPAGDMATALTGHCATLAACCPQLPANEQSACNSAATTGTDAQCASTLSGFQSAGQCH